MQLDKMTEKTREALQAASTLAENWTTRSWSPSTSPSPCSDRKSVV